MVDYKIYICPECGEPTKVHRQNLLSSIQSNFFPTAGKAGLVYIAEELVPAAYPGAFIVGAVFVLEGAWEYFYLKCGNKHCGHHFFVKRWQ